MVGIVNEPLLMHCFDQLIELRLMDSSLSLDTRRIMKGPRRGCWERLKQVGLKRRRTVT